MSGSSINKENAYAFRTGVFICFAESNSAAAAIVVRARIYNLSPVQITSVQSANEHLGSGDIRSYRNVLHIAHTQQMIFRLVKRRTG